MQRCAGVDVSKARLDVCVWPSRDVVSFANSTDGVEELTGHLSASGVDLVAVEHTGRLTRLLIDALSRIGIETAILDPRRVKHFGIVIGQEAKTDRLDAILIAHYATLVAPIVRPITTHEEFTLKDAVVRRRQLVEHRAKERTRRHEDHTAILKESIGRHHRWLDSEIALIEKQIHALISAQPDWRNRFEILTTMPGVGDVLAWTLIAELPELGHLDPKPIAQLVGVAPRPNESGTTISPRKIRGGRFHVRRTLYIASINAAMKDSSLAQFRQRLLDAGKPPMVARVAVMRKMLLTLNAMARDGRPWRPAIATDQCDNVATPARSEA